MLTDIEKNTFCQKLTKGWALGYFYVHDNVPLHFAYRDGIVTGKYSDLEKRNIEITKGAWLDAYNYYSICNIYYEFLFRPSYPQSIKSLQMPLQAFMYSKPRPISEESGDERAYVTVEQLKQNLDAWMVKEGGKLLEKRRKEPPGNYSEWAYLLEAPDRTMQLVSIIPSGNTIIMEAIITWSESGNIKETAYAGVIMYDADGTVLVDRDYMDIINWPAVTDSKLEERRRRELTAANNGQTKGELDVFLNRYKSKKLEANLTNLEKKNKETVETRWIEAHNNLDKTLFHTDRYRVQLPLQKVSYNLEISQKIEESIKKAAPDRQMREVITYAKGNQVVAEGIMSWTEGGVYKESPYLSCLLFDKDGLIIRERTYINLVHWPGASEISRIAALI